MSLYECDWVIFHRLHRCPLSHDAICGERSDKAYACPCGAPPKKNNANQISTFVLACHTQIKMKRGFSKLCPQPLPCTVVCLRGIFSLEPLTTHGTSGKSSKANFSILASTPKERQQTSWSDASAKLANNRQAVAHFNRCVA